MVIGTRYGIRLPFFVWCYEIDKFGECFVLFIVINLFQV